MQPTGPLSERPRLHFTVRGGWINDPHTLVHHEGLYHLFFQYVPESTEWRPSCCWGHATSPDLLRWEEHAPVLSPGGGDDGCWSGSMAVGSAPTIFYTSVKEPRRDLGEIRTAVPHDSGWSSWEKGDVVVAPPDDLEFFRDPFVLREGDRWRMVVGAAQSDGSAAALTYTSGDLSDWSYDGVLASRPGSEVDGVRTGAGWECPALLHVDGHDVLLVSVWDRDGPQYEAYQVGSLVEGRFVGGPWRRLTYGAYYAGALFADADGRQGLIHWMREVADREHGWAGAHSLPQLLRVEGDRLLARPHDVMKSLRRDRGETRTDGQNASGSVSVRLPADIEWTPGPAGGRLVAGGQGLSLTVSGRMLTADVGELHCTVEWDPGETARLVVDGPVVEVFTRAGLISSVLRSPRPLAGLDMIGAGTLRTWRVPAPIA